MRSGLGYKLSLVAFCAAQAMVAQEIGFNATVDRNAIAVGEYMNLTVSLTNSQQGFNAPDFGGLIVARGPSEQSSFSSVNGKMTVSISRIWTLTAQAPGTYTIGAAQVKVGGGVIKTDPIKIEVTKGSTTTAPNANEAQAQSRDKFVFASISLSKDRVLLGEQVVATYALYSHYANLNLTKLEYSKMTGFWSEDIDTGTLDWEQQLQTINGVQYKVAILKRQVLFPQKSGTLRIEPMELGCIVNRSFFNAGNEISVRSNAGVLNVQALPFPSPADFNGTVGDLEMNVAMDRNAVKANEAIQLTVKYSGRSNLKLLDAPKLHFPGDFEAYDPKVNDRISVSGSGMSGSREFEYIIIPRHEGEFDLEPITFSYFDLKSKSYRTLTSGPLHFSIAESEGGSVTVRSPNKSDVTILEKDIRYIKNEDHGLYPKGHYLFGSLPWIAGMSTPLLAFIFFLGWNKKRRTALADVQGTRRKHADRVAKKHLAEAGKYIDQPDKGPFYTALGKALHGYLADKFGVGLATFGEREMREKLSGLSGGDALAAEYVRLVTACDMARFAPVEDRPRKQLYDDAAELISKIEGATRS